MHIIGIIKGLRQLLLLILVVAVCASLSITAETASAITLPAKVPVAPAAVPWASATASGQTVIYVRWGLVPGADGYMVCRDGKRIIRTSAKATVFKQRGMAPGKRYGFTVRAFKKFYQRQWYNKATGKWQASKPPANVCGSNKIVTAFVYSAPSATKYATTAKKVTPKPTAKPTTTKPRVITTDKSLILESSPKAVPRDNDNPAVLTLPTKGTITCVSDNTDSVYVKKVDNNKVYLHNTFYHGKAVITVTFKPAS